MPPRASDSFKFRRWDQDSIRGGIQSHPGIDQFGAARSAVPRTNRRSLLARREAAFGSEGRGFESPPGAPLFPVGYPNPILAEASNASFS